jgi:hypothetical protein
MNEKVIIGEDPRIGVKGNFKLSRLFGRAPCTGYLLSSRGNISLGKKYLGHMVGSQ